MTPTETALVFCTLVFIITTLYFMHRKDMYKKRARIATEEAIYQTNVRKTSDKEFDRMSDFVTQIQKETREKNAHIMDLQAKNARIFGLDESLQLYKGMFKDAQEQSKEHLEMLQQTKRLLQKGAQGQHTVKAMRDLEEYLKNY